MPTVVFEPTVSAGERPQTYALDRAATGTGKRAIYSNIIGDITATARRLTRSRRGHVPQN